MPRPVECKPLALGVRDLHVDVTASVDSSAQNTFENHV